jgi:Flp pilus assembly protein TadD
MTSALPRVASLAAAFSGAAAPAVGAETWLQVDSQNFTVVSNAGEGTARKTAAEFEQVRAAYAKVWPWARLAQGRPMIVLALKNESTLRRWAPGYYEAKGGIDVVSGSAFGADRVYLLLRTDHRPTNKEVTPAFNLYRAYVGLLLNSSFERRLPLWLSTGLGEVLGNTFVGDKEISVGRIVPWELERFSRGGRLSLGAILDARRDSPLVRKDDQRHMFDAQCYVLVHYLLFGDQRAHAAALDRFLELWLAGGSHDQAFAEAFGDLRALEGALLTYATGRLFTYARLSTEAKLESERPAMRALAPAEIAGLQAAVHVAMRRPVEAQAAIREARTADPRSPASYDAEGMLADRDRDKPRATQAYAQAVELGSTNAYSHYRAAQLSWKPQPDGALLAALRQRLERAIELNGSYANSSSFLAEVLVQQGDGQGALEPAQRAITLAPGESYHRVALARVLHKLGRDDEARKSAELGLQLADDDDERSSAERFLLFLEQDARYAQERARRDATTACEGGDAAACARILPELDRACGEKQARTCMYLSWLYSQNAGVPRDAVRAAAYVERACAANDKRACVEHAWKLVQGDGMAKDEPRGVASLRSLCDEAFYAACTRLAVVEASKPGSAARGRAMALLARACDGGEQDACSMAGRLK